MAQWDILYITLAVVIAYWLILTCLLCWKWCRFSQDIVQFELRLDELSGAPAPRPTFVELQCPCDQDHRKLLPTYEEVTSRNDGLPSYNEAISCMEQGISFVNKSERL